MFWIVVIVGFAAAVGWLFAARERSPGSPVWSALHSAAIGFVRLFSLHLAAALGWLGLAFAGLRSGGGLVAGFRVLVIASTLGIVLHTAFAVDRRASSVGAGASSALLLAGAALVAGAAIGFFMCLPYLLD